MRNLVLISIYLVLASFSFVAKSDQYSDSRAILRDKILESSEFEMKSVLVNKESLEEKQYSAHFKKIETRVLASDKGFSIAWQVDFVRLKSQNKLHKRFKIQLIKKGEETKIYLIRDFSFNEEINSKNGGVIFESFKEMLECSHIYKIDDLFSYSATYGLMVEADTDEEYSLKTEKFVKENDVDYDLERYAMYGLKTNESLKPDEALVFEEFYGSPENWYSLDNTCFSSILAKPVEPMENCSAILSNLLDSSHALSFQMTLGYHDSNLFTFLSPLDENSNLWETPEEKKCETNYTSASSEKSYYISQSVQFL